MAQEDRMRPFGVVTKSGNVVSNERIAEGSPFAAKARSLQIEDRESLAGSIVGGQRLVEHPYPPESLIELVENNTHHFRACGTKATDAAGTGFDLLPKVPEPNTGQKERAQRFFASLSESINHTLRNAFFDYEAIGWGAIEVIRDGDDPEGDVVDLKHLPAHTLMVHRERQKYAQVRGVRRRWFKDIGSLEEIDYLTGKPISDTQTSARANELIYFRQYTQKDDFYGTPQIIPALGACLSELYREEYNQTFFKNYGVPAYAIFITGDYDPGPEDDSGRTKLERDIEQHMGELAKEPHSTLTLTIPTARRRDGSPGQVQVHFERLSDEVKEASFTRFRLDNRDEILAAHGVPKYRIGISETGSMGQNVSAETNEIYKRSRIDPVQEMIESIINSAILEDELGVEDYEWKLPDLDTNDEEHDIKIATPLFNMGAITPNELRAHFGKKFGLEPVAEDGMDDHYIGGASIEKGLLQVGKDPESTQGQRGVDEETDGLSNRGSRSTGNSEAVRRFVEETPDLSPEVRTELERAVRSERL